MPNAGTLYPGIWNSELMLIVAVTVPQDSTRDAFTRNQVSCTHTARQLSRVRLCRDYLGKFPTFQRVVVRTIRTLIGFSLSWDPILWIPRKTSSFAL